VGRYENKAKGWVPRFSLSLFELIFSFSLNFFLLDLDEREEEDEDRRLLKLSDERDLQSITLKNLRLKM